MMYLSRSRGHYRARRANRAKLDPIVGPRSLSILCSPAGKVVVVDVARLPLSREVGRGLGGHRGG